jgi:type VI protein secretion system component VasK
MAFARRFDVQLAGRFPFAPLSAAGQTDISLAAVRAFFSQQNNHPADLLAQLSRLKQSLPGAVPDQWMVFLSQLQGFHSWLQQGMTEGATSWSVPLNVSFQALPEHAQGADQIIRWTLSNGQQQSVFPNADQALIWQQGQPLWLELEWATSSAYQPYSQSLIPAAIQIPAHNTVRFLTKGQWGMFEWLQRYSNKLPGLSKIQPQGTQLLMFSVPVTLKAAPPQAQSVAYVSQAILNVSASYLDQDGLAQPVLWPVDLPHRAPGLNE